MIVFITIGQPMFDNEYEQFDGWSLEHQNTVFALVEFLRYCNFKNIL